MALNLASLNQRYNYLLNLVNSIISGLIPVVTSSPLSVVLTNGNNAGTNNIDMNNNDIENVDMIESNGYLNLNSTLGIRSNNPIVTNSTAFDKRQITTSYYNICDGGASQQNIVSTGRIFSLGTATYFDLTLVNNSSFQILVKRANINYTPLIITDVSTFKTSVVMDTTGSVINQSSIVSDNAINTLKNTRVITNFGGPSATEAFDVYDSSSGRGIRCIPNSPSASYLDLTKLNDSVIASRFRPSGAEMGLTIGLTNSAGTGIRFSSMTPTKGQVEIGAGSTNRINVYDDSDATYPNTTTYNNKIRMLGSTSDSRSINRISRVNLFDTNGTSGTGEIYISSSTNEFSYVSYTSNNRHAFYVNDGVNNNKRFQITNTSTIQNVASDTSSVTTFTSSQNGFTDTINGTKTLPISFAILNQAFFTLDKRGTYMITLSVSLINLSNTNDMVNMNNHYGLSENNTTLPNVGLLANSVMKQQNLRISRGSTNIITTTSCIFRADNDSKIIYFNGFSDYSGSSTGQLQYVISWCKIA